MPALSQVRAVFEQPGRYLNGSYHNIRIRAETVSEFTRGRHFRRILDIGCGDGSLSLPLLCGQTRLTLLDVSSAMLSLARGRVRPELIPNVDFVNEDFLTASLDGQYDLILCVGFLAHVSSAVRAIAKIASLLEQGGCVIAQVTDRRHPLTRALEAYGTMRSLFIPAPYSPTNLSAEEVVEMFAREGLELTDAYRYSLPVPGMPKIIGEHLTYRLTRYLHGHYPCCRNCRIGNEFLYQFRRSS
jgi:2-polyprenyl-3-methyl-5-hydroxy-6-metoxy-1,4-benzoquinol methylase